MNKARTATEISISIFMAAALINWGCKGGAIPAGRITQMEIANPFVEVHGIVNNSSLWLGCTVHWKDGCHEKHEPVKVSGKFSEKLYFKLRQAELTNATVYLWKRKITKEVCEKDNGSACQYCRENGFHMEGRIDSQSE